MSICHVKTSLNLQLLPSPGHSFKEQDCKCKQDKLGLTLLPYETVLGEVQRFEF